LHSTLHSNPPRYPRMHIFRTFSKHYSIKCKHCLFIFKPVICSYRWIKHVVYLKFIHYITHVSIKKKPVKYAPLPLPYLTTMKPSYLKE
jgi:hypothetical protein